MRRRRDDDAQEPIVPGTQPIEKRLLRRLAACCDWRNSQTDNTGTKVLESRYDAIIEKPTASASGTNKLCARRS